MVPFAIVISGGILFLLRVLIALWVEEKRPNKSRAQVQAKKVGGVIPFKTLARSSRALNHEVWLKSASVAVNEGDEKSRVSLGHSFKRSL